MRNLIRVIFGSTCLCAFLFSGSVIGAEEGAEPAKSLHHVEAKACKQCHEEIYAQWVGSMHAQSSALKDPIHGAFYKNVVGDPKEEGVTMKNGKYPVCHKCQQTFSFLRGGHGRRRVNSRKCVDNPTGPVAWYVNGSGRAEV